LLQFIDIDAPISDRRTARTVRAQDAGQPMPSVDRLPLTVNRLAQRELESLLGGPTDLP